jgi:hypothetical protein
MAFSDVCKVEFGDYVGHELSKGRTKKEVIEKFAEDAEISESTVKGWMYPDGKKTYEKKRSKGKKKTGKVSETIHGPKFDTEPGANNYDYFLFWKKGMEEQLDFASDILSKKVVLNSYDERLVIKGFFDKFDAFLRVYLKRRKDKELPF